MIKVNEIRDRLTWADEKPDKEIMNQYVHRLLTALREIPEDGEESARLPEAVKRAVCGLYRSAYKAGVMGCLGAGGEAK